MPAVRVVEDPPLPRARPPVGLAAILAAHAGEDNYCVQTYDGPEWYCTDSTREDFYRLQIERQLVISLVDAEVRIAKPAPPPSLIDAIFQLFMPY
jgi:hypothetical protein